MEPWKSISILPPPVQTTDIKEYIDVKGLKHICVNIVRVLSKQSPLHTEGALLSRFVYKFDKKFRNDIGYRNIKKINTTLHKYLQVNLLKDLENFTAVLPNKDENFLPTRQMLQYILCRIISFSMLMLRIYVCCKKAAIIYMDRVKRGESHWMSLMPYALLSRIWSLSAVLLQHATSWYIGLHSYHNVLQSKGLEFLPVDYTLPKSLDELLDFKNIDTIGKLDWTQRNIEVGCQEDEKYDIFGYLLDYRNKTSKQNEETEYEQFKIDPTSTKQQLNVSSISNIDQGQVISRDSFKLLNVSVSQDKTYHEKNTMQSAASTDQKQTILGESCKILSKFQKTISNQNTKGYHYFGKVKNDISLKEFLNKEEALRNDGNEQSLTNHLSFMQWQTLKTTLLKVSDSVLNNRRIEKKLQKVWKEKCLDYL